MKPLNFNCLCGGAIWLVLSLIRVPAMVFYVNVSNPVPVVPYTNWVTAATNIQNAIDAARGGDLILVTNGIYQTGGRTITGFVTNRVVMDKAVTVESINGPDFTFICGNSTVGSNSVRCIYMVANSVLSGFTLTNGGALGPGDRFLDQSGGGVWTTNNSNAVIANCVVTGNSAQEIGGGVFNGIVINCLIAHNNAYYGGGVGNFGSSGYVTNCVIGSNLSSGYGGGAWGSTLKNCVVVQNVAAIGGGTENSALYGCLVANNFASELSGGVDGGNHVANCTVVGNTALQGAGGVSAAAATIENSIIYFNATEFGNSPNVGPGTFENCCTTPLPATNYFTITNDPGFVSAVTGDYQLSSISPCINSGNAHVYTAADLAGNPRVADGFVDLGAYECPYAHCVLPFWFARQYGLPLDGSLDSDGDGMNNWEEAFAGTNPTNAASVIKILSLSKSASGTEVKWESVAGRIYYLELSTNLAASPPFAAIYTNPVSPATTLSFKDTTAPNAAASFYRVSVQ